MRLDVVLEDHGASMFIAEASCHSRDGFRATESQAAGIDTGAELPQFRLTEMNQIR